MMQTFICSLLIQNADLYIYIQVNKPLLFQQYFNSHFPFSFLHASSNIYKLLNFDP